MTEPDPNKRSLANTVTHCDLAQRASYLHDIRSKFPAMTDREIVRDFFNDPLISDTLKHTASDLKKFVSKVAKMHQTFRNSWSTHCSQLVYGDLEGRALLDHESSDEREIPIEQSQAVQPQDEQQQQSKKKKRGRTRAQRKARKTAKMAEDMQSLQIKREVMDSDYEFA
eukprot:jgi/Botrbrau1/12053/Bobra.0295s0008.1